MGMHPAPGPTMSPLADRPDHYEVVLPGILGPAVLATVAELGLDQVVITSSFMVSVPDHLGIREVTAMLVERDLAVLMIREVPHSGSA